MPTVGTINIDLRMGTAAVVSGASKAAGAISGMAKSITNSIKSIGTSIVPTISVEGIVSSLKNISTAAAGNIDTVAKLSDRLGISTESLVGMAHAADLAGVSNEEFGGMLEKLQKNLGKIAEDGGTAKNAIRELGLSVADVTDQPIDQTFKQVASAIEKVHDPILRGRYAMDLFGKSGQQLINTLMAGGKSIDEAITEAAKLGMAFSRIDAAKVEAANDAFTRLKGAILGIGNTITIGLAPYIEKLNTSLTMLVATSGQDFGKMIVSAFTAGVDAAQLFYASILRIGVKLGEIMADLGLMMNKIGHSGLAKMMGLGDMRGAGIAVADAGNNLALNSRVSANAADSAPRWSSAIPTAAAAKATESVAATKGSGWDDIIRPFDTLIRKFNVVRDSGKEIGQVFKTMAQGIKDDARKMGEAITLETLSPLEKFQADMNVVKNLQQQGALGINAGQRKRFEAFKTLADATGGFVTQSPTAAEAGTSSAANAIAQFRNEGRDGGQRTLMDVLREAKEQTRLQQQMAAAIERQANAIPDIAKF